MARALSFGSTMIAAVAALAQKDRCLTTSSIISINTIAAQRGLPSNKFINWYKISAGFGHDHELFHIVK